MATAPDQPRPGIGVSGQGWLIALGTALGLWALIGLGVYLIVNYVA